LVVELLELHEVGLQVLQVELLLGDEFAVGCVVFEVHLAAWVI